MSIQSNLTSESGETVNRRNFSSFPRELTSIIFENLQLTDKLSIRESCTRLHHHIDDHFRRKFIQWMRKLSMREDNAIESLHDDILLLSIEQFVNKNFTPPMIESLIELTENIANFSSDPWHDIKVPNAIEEREKLLKLFYERANERFTEVDRKMLFTLTLLQMLKTLCKSPFDIVHPFNRKANLRLSFKISNLFFVIPFYQFVFDWFRFDCDWIAVLLFFVKWLEMRAAKLKNENVAWTKMIRPAVFEHASIIFGSDNWMKKSRASCVKCTVEIAANREMIQELKMFMHTGIFDYEKTADTFNVNFEFFCPNSKNSNFRSTFPIRINHQQPNHPSLNLREDIQ